jgi:hypothetical protein
MTWFKKIWLEWKRLWDSSCAELPAGMSDAELEKHIASCGQLMRDHYAYYEVWGCQDDRAIADGWLKRMEAAIAMRSPARVLAMEIERGLAAHG